jgi:hypothetical protein
VDGREYGVGQLRGRVAVLRQEEELRLLRPRRRGFRRRDWGQGQDEHEELAARVKVGPNLAGLYWAGLYTALIFVGY